MNSRQFKEYISQYQNNAICDKWHNNIPLEELNTEEYQYTELSQDIESICEMFSFLPSEDITGIVYIMGDGDYSELYVTESARPYDLQSIYHPLTYYL